MKEVLNFTLEEVLLPQSHRFQPYMQEVESFLTKLSNRLSQCVSSFLSLTPDSPACLPSSLLLFRALLHQHSLHLPRLAARGASATPSQVILNHRYLFLL